MKTQSEKEKKLDIALSKLINLNLNVNLKENLQNLNLPNLVILPTLTP